MDTDKPNAACTATTQMNGRGHGNHQGEMLSSLKHRPEGLRLKHQANGNSIKLYDKQGSVLRVETTPNRDVRAALYPGHADVTQVHRQRGVEQILRPFLSVFIRVYPWFNLSR